MSPTEPAGLTLDVRQTIVRIVQLHTDEPIEEAGFIADDIMQALRLSDEITVTPPPAAPLPKGQHIWPCPLFYTGNWNDDRPRAVCTCRPPDVVLEATP